jgi:hypothetical protein
VSNLLPTNKFDQLCFDSGRDYIIGTNLQFCDCVVAERIFVLGAYTPTINMEAWEDVRLAIQTEWQQVMSTLKKY